MFSVSIIIATSGRTEALKETLRSLGSVQVPAGWFVELILAENVAQAGAEELIRAFPRKHFSAVRYLFEPTKGKSRALNLALAHATGEVLLFSDDDVRFPTDWIERMCEPIFAGRADGVAGGVRLAADLLRPWMSRRHRAWLANTADYLTSENPSEMCGANMAIRRTVLDQTGGFDPELGPGITGGSEESLISWQLTRAGHKILGALHVEIEHHPNADRLQYRNWVRAAIGKGESNAYLLHHWFHQSISYPYLRKLLLTTKLTLRKLISPRPNPNDEGIAIWELCYIEEQALYDRFIRERRRPRQYSLSDLRKITTIRPSRAA